MSKRPIPRHLVKQKDQNDSLLSFLFPNSVLNLSFPLSLFSLPRHSLLCHPSKPSGFVKGSSAFYKKFLNNYRLTPARIRCQLKSSSACAQSSFPWCSIYFWIIFVFTPVVLTKYPSDQMIPTGVNTICLLFELHALCITQRLRRRNPQLAHASCPLRASTKIADLAPYSRSGDDIIIFVLYSSPF